MLSPIFKNSSFGQNGVLFVTPLTEPLEQVRHTGPTKNDMHMISKYPIGEC